MNIVQIRVGKPQDISTESGLVRTALLKKEISGPVAVTKKGLEGDGWGNPNVHGTPNQIICAYPEKHYRYWRDYLSIKPFSFGSFGENIILSNCDETTVRIGDICKVGDALLEITSPRKPCSTLNKVWESNSLMKHMAQTSKTGWFYKIVREGSIEAGMKVELISSDEGKPTVLESWLEQMKAK